MAGRIGRWTTATAGPLAAGAQATAKACAWTSTTPTTLCATFTATGVDPSPWQLEIGSGAGQSINAPDTLAPVVLRVLNSLGHPIAGAPVTVHQILEP